MEHYLEDPSSNTDLAVEIFAIAGTDIWTELLRGLNTSQSPAAWLAKFAPLATRQASNGDGWATNLLEVELGALAATTGRHVARYLDGSQNISLCLAGGVWNSQLAVDVYCQALKRITSCSLRIEKPTIDAAIGAIAFANGTQ
jgi:N-acetylglucosamine kinase-like BadF-type ATPase